MKLDATAFKLLERKRRFKPQTIEIAKRRILRQEPATALAAEYGVNSQRIYTIEAQVTTAWQGPHLPVGWSEITLVAPKPLVAELKRRSRAARKQLCAKRSSGFGQPPESPLRHSAGNTLWEQKRLSPTEHCITLRRRYF
jgi:TrfB plasmid transcriptional repressor